MNPFISETPRFQNFSLMHLYVYPLKSCYTHKLRQWLSSTKLRQWTSESRPFLKNPCYDSINANAFISSTPWSEESCLDIHIYEYYHVFMCLQAHKLNDGNFFSLKPPHQTPFVSLITVLHFLTISILVQEMELRSFPQAPFTHDDTWQLS